MMLDDYPDTFTVVQIHINDAYSTPWGNARAGFYGVSGTPIAWFGGVLQCVGAYTNVTQQYNWYLQQYNTRRGISTDVVIDMTATGAGVVQVDTTVSRETGTGGDLTMRVYIVKVLDYWPATGGYHRNGFREAAASVDITLAPGESQLIQRTFVLDQIDEQNLDNVKFIAWAQVPSASAPASVYQAATTGLEPPGPPEIHTVVPATGTIAGNTFVTISGANFGYGTTVEFDGVPAADVVLLDSETLTCKTPAGGVCGPVDVTVESHGSTDTLLDGFSYFPTLSIIGTPCIGCDLIVFARGVPLGAWGAVKDDTLGPKYKKEIWWEIGFVNWEIVHATWRGGSALNGLGQGSDTYSIPNDPGLIGTPLYFEGVFDGNGPEIGKNLVTAELQTVIIVP
jgi:hypothetical protein